MLHPAGLDFLVNKSDWKQHHLDDAPAPELADGQVLFRVDRFAFTANNITYAVAGESLRYWNFFPAPEGWLEVKRGVGPQDVARVYEETLAGRTEPHHGHVLTLWDES